MTDIQVVEQPTEAEGTSIPPRPTGAAARYLKAMWYLSSQPDSLTVGRVAERVGVSHASASVVVKQLVADGLAVRGENSDLALAPAGEAEAVRLVRRHRLVETFLVAVLKVGWDEVHEEAERIEWVLSDDIVERIADLLGDPERSPHGGLIPTTDGTFPEVADVPLSELAPAEKARIVRVSNRDPDFLRYLASEGLGIGTVVTMEGREPFGGPLWLRSSRGRHALGEAAVEAIAVARVAGHRSTGGRGSDE
jgi:DtxR family transcriptional regulator, Mn-dependent transcriptional regulator